MENSSVFQVGLKPGHSRQTDYFTGLGMREKKLDSDGRLWMSPAWRGFILALFLESHPKNCSLTNNKQGIRIGNHSLNPNSRCQARTQFKTRYPS